MTSHPDPLDVLQAIAQNVQSPSHTEADTRATMIDPLLAAMGWNPEEIRREPYDEWQPAPGYLDYLLLVHGQPYIALEAKKAPVPFVIP